MTVPALASVIRLIIGILHRVRDGVCDWKLTPDRELSLT